MANDGSAQFYQDKRDFAAQSNRDYSADHAIECAECGHVWDEVPECICCQQVQPREPIIDDTPMGLEDDWAGENE
jgi:hypothetical protein